MGYSPGGNGTYNLVRGGVLAAMYADELIGGNNANTTFSGSIGGSGGLVKSGSGTLTLTGSNSFTGGLVLDPGIVSINQRRRLGRPTGIATSAP